MSSMVFDITAQTLVFDTNAAGPQGPQGPAGVNGSDGADGAPGVNGADGVDGIFAGNETIETSIADGDILSFQDISNSNNVKRITKSNLLDGLSVGSGLVLQYATEITSTSVEAGTHIIVCGKYSETSQRVRNFEYVRHAGTPSPVEAWHLQSSDGAYWELSTDEVCPEFFGANGTAGTDQTTAIQAAIDYAVEFGVLFHTPFGNYDVPTLGLTIGGSFVSKKGAGVIRRTTDVSTVLLSATSQDLVQISSLRFQYTAGTTAVDGNHCAVRLTSCTNSYIRGCRSVGKFYVGFEIRDCNTADLSNNFVKGTDNRALYASAVSLAQNIAIKNNIIRGDSVTDYGINTNCFGTGQILDIQINGNEIESCVNQGIEIGDRITAFQVIGNICQNITTGPGILIQRANSQAPTDSVVIGNILRGCQEGIYANDAFYVDVNNNKALSCGTGFKFYDFRYGSISGNSARACSGNGFDIDASTAANTIHFKFVDNYALQNTGTGINSTGNARNGLFNSNKSILNTAAQSNIVDTAASHTFGTNSW